MERSREHGSALLDYETRIAAHSRKRNEIPCKRMRRAVYDIEVCAGGRDKAGAEHTTMLSQAQNSNVKNQVDTEPKIICPHKAQRSTSYHEFPYGSINSTDRHYVPDPAAMIGAAPNGVRLLRIKPLVCTYLALA